MTAAKSTEMTTEMIARDFVQARRQAMALADYPGGIPASLAQSYAIQDHAITLWDAPMAGWKIARLAPDKQAAHGTERLSGPVFAATVKSHVHTPVVMPVFTGGFAAVEAEFVFRIDHDADPAKTRYSEEEALRLVDAMFAGVEMAGSPLATINSLGPTVTASDFGNNFGLIVGDKLAGFDSDVTIDALSPEAVQAYATQTVIDGHIVGTGGLFSLPGGPLAAIAWLAGHLAERGRPLRQGQLISSGATTGVHRVQAGQAAVATFNGPHGVTAIALATTALAAGAAELS